MHCNLYWRSTARETCGRQVLCIRTLPQRKQAFERLVTAHAQVQPNRDDIGKRLEKRKLENKKIKRQPNGTALINDMLVLGCFERDLLGCKTWSHMPRLKKNVLELQTTHQKLPIPFSIVLLSDTLSASIYT